MLLENHAEVSFIWRKRCSKYCQKFVLSGLHELLKGFSQSKEEVIYYDSNYLSCVFPELKLISKINQHDEDSLTRELAQLLKNSECLLSQRLVKTLRSYLSLRCLHLHLRKQAETGVEKIEVLHHKMVDTLSHYEKLYLYLFVIYYTQKLSTQSQRKLFSDPSKIQAPDFSA